MPSVDLDVTGMDELQQFFSEPQPLATRQQIRRAVKSGGELIMEDAKSRIHSVTGNLANSLMVSTVVGQSRIAATVHHGEGGPHDHLVEYGHEPGGWNKGVQPVLPHPYLWPAFEAQKKAAYDLVKNAVAEEVKKS